MKPEDKIKWADEQITAALDAFETKTFDKSKLTKITDSQAMDIVARTCALALDEQGPEAAKKASAVFLTTLSRTGRAHDDWKE